MKASLALASTCFFLLTLQAPAFEAISSFEGDGPPFEAWGGAGFAFSPQTVITITALGSAVPPYLQNAMVTLRDSNGLPLVSVLVTASSPQSNGAYYETIAPFTMPAGQMCYVSSVETNSGAWLGSVIGFDTNGTFTVGPGLSYVGAAFGANADGTFPVQFYPAHFWPLGPNFIYVTGPLMTMTGLQVTPGQVQIGFGVSGVPANSFTLLESDQPGGPWTTNLPAVLTTNIPGVSYTFTTSPHGPVHFYRVQTP
jgi:hypothetical protein